MIFLRKKCFSRTKTHHQETDNLHSPVLKSLAYRNKTKSSRNVLKSSLTEVPDLTNSYLITNLTNTSIEIENTTSRNLITTLLPLCPDSSPYLRKKNT